MLFNSLKGIIPPTRSQTRSDRSLLDFPKLYVLTCNYMIFIRKVFKTGNSYVFAIPSEIIKALDLKVGSQFIVESDPKKDRIIYTKIPDQP